MAKIDSSFGKNFDCRIDEFCTLMQSTARLLDEKSIHDLRVSTRKLRMLLWIIKNGTPLKIPKALEHRLKSLGHALGRRRQIDVLIHDAEHYGFSARLHEQSRKSETLALKRWLSAHSQNQTIKSLHQVRQELVTQSEVHQKRVLKKAFKKLNLARSHFPRTPEKIHQLRIQAKKARYILEGFKKPCRPLKTLQEQLGRFHDLEVLKSTLGPSKRMTCVIKDQKHLLKSCRNLTVQLNSLAI